MATRLFQYLNSKLIHVNGIQIRHNTYTPRKSSRGRGKPPGVARTLKQRIEEINYVDPALHYKVNIGFSQDKNKVASRLSECMKIASQNKRNKDFQLQAIHHQIKLDYEKVREEWKYSSSPSHLKTIGEHYGVFSDLYGDAYFHPIVPLTINFDYGDKEHLATVYNGNILKPREVKNKPNVHYDAPKDSFWTLQMTTPDGNLSSPDNEYCHWLVSNIPENDINKGEELIDYMRPIPCRGIGYCRYIFVLYKQDTKIDVSDYKKEQPCLNLVERNWKTYDFYKKYQDVMTPAGLAFFQSDWDDSLVDFFHDSLKMREPIFEYDFPKPYIAPEKWFPKKEPFDEYLDMYRDPKEINKEYLLNKLKKTHPFDGPEPPLKWPNAQPFDNDKVPSWLKKRLVNERLGWGRVNEIK